MNVSVITKISRMIKDGTIKPMFGTALRGGANIVLGFYKTEMPVDKGFARNSVQIYPDIQNGFIVTTKITQNGFRYPSAVHNGTGAFRNSSRDYPSTGRVRSGTVGRGIGGIRPNRFADRTRAKSDKPVMELFNNSLKDLLKSGIQEIIT